MAGTVLERIRTATAEERGQIGRDIYTYLHLPIIAGIVLVAVGDELVIAHPTDDLDDAGALVALGGPALFLGGLMVCAARLGQAQSRPGPSPWSHCSPPRRSARAPTGWSCWR